MHLVFKALSDKSRLEILQLLKRGDKSVTELQKHFSFTQATLSHHLDLLKRAELVIAQRQGQFMYYSLNMSVFEEMMAFMLKMTKKKK